LSTKLSVAIFIPIERILDSLIQLLSRDRYHLYILNSANELNDFVIENKEKIDCLIILNHSNSFPIINKFYEQGLILPVIIIEPEPLTPELINFESDSLKNDNLVVNSGLVTQIYHMAEIRIRLNQLNTITNQIDKAITQFLHLAPTCSLSEKPTQTNSSPQQIEEKQNFLLLQQRRLAEKLKERLGYLGIYYNRNPKYFYRRLSQQEKEELIEQLSKDYREIILSYFTQESEINQQIDDFVNQAFFSDLSVSQILEIHMELMDQFAQQLKLEGRNEDVLLDYRLALIDIIAHLCEMYRRSIPREDLPFEVFFPVD
jgi:circadian clock protein KaiA